MDKLDTISQDVLIYELMPYLPLRELYHLRDLPEAEKLFRTRLAEEVTTKQGSGEVIKLALMELNTELFNYVYERLYKLGYSYKNGNSLDEEEIDYDNHTVFIDIVSEFLVQGDIDFTIAFFKAEGQIDNPFFHNLEESWGKLGEFAGSSLPVARLVTSREVLKAMRLNTTYIIYEMFHWARENWGLLRLALNGLWNIYFIYGYLPKDTGYYLPWQSEELELSELGEVNDLELLASLELELKYKFDWIRRDT